MCLKLCSLFGLMLIMVGRHSMQLIIIVHLPSLLCCVCTCVLRSVFSCHARAGLSACLQIIVVTHSLVLSFLYNHIAVCCDIYHCGCAFKFVVCACAFMHCQQLFVLRIWISNVRVPIAAYAAWAIPGTSSCGGSSDGKRTGAQQARV